MYKVNGTTITMTRGDTARINVKILMDGEEYTPEQGDVIRFAAKKDYADDETAILKIVPNDTMILTIEPADTKQLDFGYYKYDMQITFADGDVYTFIAKATLVIDKEVD